MRTLFHFFKNKPEWMNDFHNQLQIVFNERKGVIISAAGFIATLMFLITLSHQNTKVNNIASSQNKHSAVVLHELKEMNSFLHDVEISPFNTKQQQVTLQALEKDVLSAQKSLVGVAKSDDIQRISGQIASVKDDIDIQMGNLKKSLSESGASKQYLDANTLPFHVISVDVIAGQPYVSVEYASHISPLAVGDLLTGWRVISADYDLGSAEFVNDKNQYIKINLQG
jgi:hypothetical protein